MKKENIKLLLETTAESNSIGINHYSTKESPSLVQIKFSETTGVYTVYFSKLQKEEQVDSIDAAAELIYDYLSQYSRH
ncbi:hypothetical protein M4S82_15745 [Planococcus sp. MERTA32b]|nr:hypothetical protein [Planococcus sp. MER TA 32b]